jgi:hypothetical protein
LQPETSVSAPTAADSLPAELLAAEAALPRPKRLTVLTIAPALSVAAIDEWKTGIEQFIEWANRARTGETSLPEALQADEALTAFSEGRFHVRFVDLSAWAVVAGKTILAHVRDSHWHLRPRSVQQLDRRAPAGA